jgi:hypothetical protein
MATPENLMGLGMHPILSRVLGKGIYTITATGSTAGDAKQIPGVPGIYFVNTGTSAVVLPLVGGEPPTGGALLGDEFMVANIAASLVVFAANNAKGSAVTIFGNGISVAGTTGLSITSGWMGWFYPITISTWFMAKGSA